MKKYFVTSAVLLLCLLLFFYTRYWEQPTTTDNETTLYSLSRADIRSFRIREGAQQLHIEKKPDGSWRLIDPDAAGDADKIAAFLEAWVTLRAIPVELTTPSWSQFGLEPPLKELHLLLTTGEEKKVAIGKKSPVGWNVYLRLVDNNQLYLIPAYQADQLSADPKKFKAEPLPASKPPSPVEAVPDPSSLETDGH